MARFAQAAETMGDRGLPAESRSILLEVEEDGFAAEPCDARRRQRPRSWPRSGTGDGPGASAGFGLRTSESLADRALVVEPIRPSASHYALAYLGSLSPRHLMYPPTNPADLAKLADSQADMLVGVIRAVLDGLGLPDEQWERGSEIAQEALRACTVPGWEP